MRAFSLRGHMRTDIRFFGLALVLAGAAACNQPPASQQLAPAGQEGTTNSTAPAATVPSTGSGAAPGGGSGASSGGSGATAAQSAANPVREQATSKPSAPTTMA